MISVVIPLYNKRSTIGAAIDSVLTQSVDNWELIVVDDGSTDDGGEVVSRYADPRIRFVSKANGGVSTARNEGVALAAHDLVAFLDADDSWHPEHLASLLELRGRCPDACLLGCAYFITNDAGHTRKICVNEAEIDSETAEVGNYFRFAAGKDRPLLTSAVAVSKSALLATGGFPVGVAAGEDIITWARLAYAGKVAYSTRATVYYVLPAISRKRTARDIRRPQLPDHVGDELRRLGAQRHSFGRSLDAYRGDWHRMRAILFLELGDRAGFVRELLIAIATSGIALRDFANMVLLPLPETLRGEVLSLWRQRHAMRSLVRRPRS
ncbi:glycosyltransferase [Rhodocyclus tenuis]|uniref:glycosyltransferase family 2 protein n=1 Tax=Rhodocyclus gracilis TaxID=2929842 RepID=UPI001298CCE7|nr:glycosyltransferase family A protein [Rhodocyclus gracilis]MRD73015.1 glycosyltransferase [Rhodocyclus gracilis]